MAKAASAVVHGWWWLRDICRGQPKLVSYTDVHFSFPPANGELGALPKIVAALHGQFRPASAGKIRCAAQNVCKIYNKSV